ncbi:MAG: DUF2807 domain-containing protein [Burkholderiaceae bacterium]|nr:DUF2807 domain-containing protein [Burkholderiaceae bacterium]
MFKKKFFAISVFFLLSAQALAADNSVDFNVQVKPESSGIRINWGSKTVYGNSMNQIEGSGKIVEKERNVNAYSKIRVLGPMDVKLNSSNAERVKVIADDNIEPLIETRLEGDTLVIDIKKNSGFTTRNKIIVQVNFKKLEGLALAGSGDVYINRIVGEKCSASISGSGDIKIADMDVAQFIGSVSGSGDLRASGKATIQTWSIAGSGDVWSENLNGQTIKVSIAGSGDARVGPADNLDVTIAGSGDVTYSGKPTIKKLIVGSGSVSAR